MSEQNDESEGLELPDLEEIPQEESKETMQRADEVLKTFAGADANFGTEQHINNIIANLSKMEDLETLTDLNDKEIVVITRLLWLSETYNAESGKILAKKLLQTKVSRGRGGRTELVQALIGAFRMEIEKAQQKKVEV
jgi:hypothetical protein